MKDEIDAIKSGNAILVIPKDRAPSGVADVFANDMSSIDARAWRAMRSNR